MEDHSFVVSKAEKGGFINGFKVDGRGGEGMVGYYRGEIPKEIDLLDEATLVLGRKISSY
ncbi:hypothetical protein CK203_009151 [Vitis vinifera]|uniref:Uncharacterized protein n=1 Tax=Vitis vinifera TaxID=29760 RepID=A0A438K348_VITVI|nr:hypothetical protein CK203_009151 [Vitis vinifera]